MGRWPPILVVLLLWTVSLNAEYLFTMPRSMEAGTSTQYCITLKGYTSSDVQFIYRTITIINPRNNYTEENQEYVSGKRGNQADWSVCEEFPVPDISGEFQMIAKLVIDGDDIFLEEKDIKIKKPDLITLVQTDKPIYKPGQTVKLRAITMDYQLNAKTTGFPKISILSPNGMMMMEWTDVPAPSGLVSLQMPLSTDPVLGDWKVVANDGHADVEEVFKVDKYVLPKFEVTITPPPYLLPTTPTIAGTVCAKYTYGKEVKGTLKMDICFKADWQSSYYKERPCESILEKIDGCFDFYIPADNIKLGHRGYTSWGNLNINASVTEDATGVELNGFSKGPALTQNILKLKMEDDSDNYFKPGLPFRARVIVTNPDGTTAPGEEIAVTASSYNSRYEWKKNFTSDENGIVHYVLTDIPPDTGSLSLQAKAIRYKTDWRYTDDELYFRTYTPGAWSYLKQWYSPSDSFVYIKDIDEKVDCDSKLSLDVFYNTVPETSYKFFAIVKAGDRVVQTVDQTHEFDGTLADLDLLSIDPDQILQKYRRNIPDDCVPGQHFSWRDSECRPCPVGQYQKSPGMTWCSWCPENETSTEDRLGCTPDFLQHTDRGATTSLSISQDTTFIFGPHDGIVPVLNYTIVELPRKKRSEQSDDKLLTHFTLDLHVDQTMAPNAKVLVYYIREDFEVVATSVNFNIKSCFRNKVMMEFTPTTVRPGNNVNLHLEASPASTCFVGMVDKSINLLGGSNQLTPSQVFDNVQRVARPWSWVSYWQEDRDYCNRKSSPTSRKEDEFPYMYGYSYSRPEGADSVFAFRDAEMWVVTDTVLESRPCKEYRPPVYFMRTGGGGAPNGMSGPAGGGIQIMEESAPVADDEEPQVAETQTAKIRSLFPETWLWDIVSIGDDGMFDMATPIPDTITNWVGNSLCTHPEAGVGVTEITEVTAFQPFFLSFTLPYSAVRGEIVPVLVTVFNYLSDCIAMRVQLSEGEGFHLSSSAPTRQFCLCGGLSESTKFNIVPTVVGEIDIEATAVSIANENTCMDVVLNTETVGVSDGVQRQLPIEAEGVPQEVTESIYLCTKSFPSDTTFSIDMRLPDDLVPDSERAKVAVIGDIMGPTLSNLKNLLRMPYGCGEQNIASSTPNIFILQYLTNTNQLTEKIEEEAKGYMRVGYQRQMKYRHSDNSYSAWGEQSRYNVSGSSWLSAFVVKSFAQSMPYITIDGDDVQKTVNWLISTQATSGDMAGCFPKVGKVFSSYMKGGLADGENPAGLTAFILIALLEANIDVVHPAIRLGFQCLDRQPLTDTYTLAIMTYAYSLYDSQHPVRQQLMSELNRRKVSESGLEYWRREGSEFSEDDREYRYWWRAPSAEVEMTAYVLLAKLVADRADALAEAQPIVQWLTRQRNSYGGFSSTQDTVVALQALATFASLSYSGDTNMQLEVKGPGIDHVFTVTPQNSLLYQTQTARAGQGDISYSISGTGCTMMQVVMKYNIFKLEEEGPAFDVKVSVYRSRAFRSKCDRRTIEVCTSYKKPGGVSNMAIAEVKMPTGWEPVVESLDLLTDNQRIAKYESDEGFVELYFDEIGRQRKCVDFDVTQEILMNPKPARVTVYDYYETKHSVVKTYEIKTFCGTKEELPFPKPGDIIDDTVQRRVDISGRAQRLSCPMCPSEGPTGKTESDLICDSAAVFKAIVGRQNRRYPAKVKSNLRTKKKHVIDAFVQYRMAENCDCPVLNRGETRALIFTSLANLNKEGELLTLDSKTTVLAVTKSLEKKVRTLSKLEKRCDKLKRRRRSKQRRSG